MVITAMYVVLSGSSWLHFISSSWTDETPRNLLDWLELCKHSSLPASVLKYMFQLFRDSGENSYCFYNTVQFVLTQSFSIFNANFTFLLIK